MPNFFTYRKLGDLFLASKHVPGPRSQLQAISQSYTNIGDSPFSRPRPVDLLQRLPELLPEPSGTPNPCWTHCPIVPLVGTYRKLNFSLLTENWCPTEID